MDITDYLLEFSWRVGVVPGDGFGADNNLRLSFATSLTGDTSWIRSYQEGVAIVLILFCGMTL